MTKRHSHKRPKPGPSRQSWMKRQFDRLFSPRNIIIISEHKTDHVPLSIKKQLVWTIAVLGMVAWGSFFTGNYMAAQETLREKERMIANSHLKNRRIESEFALLKRDMVSMLEGENQEDLGEYAQFVIQQYRDNGHSLKDIEVDLSQLANSNKHGPMFERIAFLEQTVRDMKHEHETIMTAIEETAQGKLSELEEIVSMSGLDMHRAETLTRKEVEETMIRREKSKNVTPRGGPYDSVNESLLKSYNKDLYGNLKRLVVLDELVEFMPTAEPMSQYRITSGYGMRIDPFRRRPANHAGLDFAGPKGSKIYAASDGTVKRAGRVGAYGLLVELEHGAKLSTRYGHLSKILVEKGQTVRKGQVIGIQGSSGRSTGAHLHYEVRFEGKTLNPKKFLEAGKHVRILEKNNDTRF